MAKRSFPISTSLFTLTRVCVYTPNACMYTHTQTHTCIYMCTCVYACVSPDTSMTDHDLLLTYFPGPVLSEHCIILLICDLCSVIFHFHVYFEPLILGTKFLVFYMLNSLSVFPVTELVWVQYP